VIAFIVSILSYVWRAGDANDPVDGNWPRLTPTQALGPRLSITAFVVLGLLNFLMILRTFKKYGKTDGPFIELPGPQQISERDATSSAARGRNISRKAAMEPQANSLVREGSSSTAGINDLEKGGVEKIVAAKL
jgi:hypothetical protein